MPLIVIWTLTCLSFKDQTINTFNREEEAHTAYDFLMNFVDVLIEEHMVTDDEVGGLHLLDQRWSHSPESFPHTNNCRHD